MTDTKPRSGDIPTTAPELLPCPFCLEKPRGPYFVTGMAYKWCIRCEACKFNYERCANASDDGDPIRAELIAAWNTRTHPPNDDLSSKSLDAGPEFVNAEIVLLCGIAKEARREHDASDGHFSTEEVLLLERIARFPAVCETVEGGAARVEVREIAVRDAPDARQVWLINGGQSFTVGDYWDDPEDAEMYAKCLRHAIRTPAPPMDSLPRYASAKTLRDKHPEMSHLHTEEPAHPSDTSADRRDAERYRWLRDNWGRAGQFLNPADLDACVDWHTNAAIARDAQNARGGNG